MSPNKVRSQHKGQLGAEAATKRRAGHGENEYQEPGTIFSGSLVLVPAQCLPMPAILWQSEQ